MGLLGSQCTFVWGENQKKKFLTSSPVETLILFNEAYQDLLKCKFFWGGSQGGWSQGERVGLSPRDEIMKQVLVGGLLWLSGNP